MLMRRELFAAYLTCRSMRGEAMPVPAVNCRAGAPPAAIALAGLIQRLDRPLPASGALALQRHNLQDSKNGTIRGWLERNFQ